MSCHGEHTDSLPVSWRRSSPIIICRTRLFAWAQPPGWPPANAEAAAQQARLWARRLTTTMSFFSPTLVSGRHGGAAQEDPHALVAGKVCNALRTSLGESSGATVSSWAVTRLVSGCNLSRTAIDAGASAQSSSARRAAHSLTSKPSLARPTASSRRS